MLLRLNNKPNQSSSCLSSLLSLVVVTAILVASTTSSSVFVSASLCELSTTPLTSIDTEYPIPDVAKLSVVGFQASVNYVYLPPGSIPSLKIVAASEEPEVITDPTTGALTISTSGTCPQEPPSLPPICASISRTEEEDDPCAGVEASSQDPSSATSIFSSSSSSTTTMMGLLSVPFLLASRGGVGSSLCIMALLSSSSLFPSVFGQEDCTPSLEIEISIPQEASVTSKFGETDHYLAATVDTVTWGYYDPNATSKISMQSGETITVEVITHHSGHDYAKMIRGDTAVEEIFYWEAGQSLVDKPEPKLPGSGVHLVTGPIEVVGAEPGDVVQVEILELDPRYNPETGKCYGTNSQKFAGYQYRLGEKRDGTPYVRSGGTEAITVFEFVEDDDGNMLYGAPVYMYRFPNMTAPDGSERTFDNNPAVMVPHEFNVGYNGELLEEGPIAYPEGFDDTVVTDEGGIVYMSPDPAGLDWKVPLRPHLGTLAVMPNNTANYIDEAAPGGANTIFVLICLFGCPCLFGSLCTQNDLNHADEACQIYI